MCEKDIIVFVYNLDSFLIHEHNGVYNLFVC